MNEEINDIHDTIYNDTARDVIELGNRLVDRHSDDFLWDVADGLLAGAVQYWLYSRSPCEDPRCLDCETINTAEKRLKELMRFVDEMARESEYFHSPNDTNVGRA